jgi:aconitate hydratase
MGVLPLEFEVGVNRITLGLDGREVYDVEGDLMPGATVMLVVQHKLGEVVRVPMRCRLDTAEEVSVYAAGGVLQRFAQDFLAARAGVAPSPQPLSREGRGARAR